MMVFAKQPTLIYYLAIQAALVQPGSESIIVPHQCSIASQGI